MCLCEHKVHKLINTLFFAFGQNSLRLNAVFLNLIEEYLRLASKLKKRNHMLNWIITFFLLGVVAAVLGFGGLAGSFIQIAQFLAYLFVTLFVLGLIYHLVSGRTARPLP